MLSLTAVFFHFLLVTCDCISLSSSPSLFVQSTIAFNPITMFCTFVLSIIIVASAAAPGMAIPISAYVLHLCSLLRPNWKHPRLPRSDASVFARVNHGLEAFHINLTSLGHDAEKAVGGLLQFAPDLLHSLSHGHSDPDTADAADALGDLGEDAAGLAELLVRVAPSSEAVHFNQTMTGHEIERATGDVPALPPTVLTWLRGGAEEERYVKTRRELVNKMVRRGVLDKLD